MKNYHIIGKDGKQAGPFPGEELVNRGVTRDTFVWCEGMSNWQKAGEVTELCAIFAPAAASTQPIQPKPAQQPAQAAFGQQQPQTFQQRPAAQQPAQGAFGQQQPAFGQQQPQAFQQRPAAQQPAQGAFGQQQPFGQQRPAFGQQQPQAFQQRPAQGAFGQRPAQPGFGQPVQPSTGLPNPAAGQTKPDSWLWLAICSTVLCCIPLGVVSIVFATQVDSKWAAGDFAGAEDASKKAKLWGIIAAGSGLLAGLLYFIFIMASGLLAAL